jgi:peroxiredoxin Q/BCP
VLGISCDSPADNRAFKAKFDFPYDLLSDEDRQVSMAYGAAATADQPYPARISYLIDPDGRVARVYEKVVPAEHTAQVLADLP